MMKRIVFRADAKPSIGTGDLVSLINLSRYFERAGWETHFIVKNYSTATGLLAKHKIANRLVLESGTSANREIELINNYIETNSIDVVMLEITERKLTEYKGLSERAIKTCINFDGIIPEDMRLTVNWDVNAGSIFDKRKYPGTKFLLGPEYVVLPVDFDFDRINRREYSTEPTTLLVTMGGADELNITQKIIDAFLDKKADLSLRIVVGSGYGYLEGLEASLKPSSAKYVIRQNIDNIFDEFMSCDAAIGAGGLTSFELIATRTPSFLIAAYEHQIPRCAYFDKMGWATYLGFRKFDEDMLFESLCKAGKIPPRNIFKTEEIRKSVDEILQRR